MKIRLLKYKMLVMLIMCNQGLYAQNFSGNNRLSFNHPILMTRTPSLNSSIAIQYEYADYTPENVIITNRRVETYIISGLYRLSNSFSVIVDIPISSFQTNIREVVKSKFPPFIGRTDEFTRVKSGKLGNVKVSFSYNLPNIGVRPSHFINFGIYLPTAKFEPLNPNLGSYCECDFRNGKYEINWYKQFYYSVQTIAIDLTYNGIYKYESYTVSTEVGFTLGAGGEEHAPIYGGLAVPHFGIGISGSPRENIDLRLEIVAVKYLDDDRGQYSHTQAATGIRYSLGKFTPGIFLSSYLDNLRNQVGINLGLEMSMLF